MKICFAELVQFARRSTEQQSSLSSGVVVVGSATTGSISSRVWRETSCLFMGKRERASEIDIERGRGMPHSACGVEIGRGSAETRAGAAHVETKPILSGQGIVYPYPSLVASQAMIEEVKTPLHMELCRNNAKVVSKVLNVKTGREATEWARLRTTLSM